MSQHDISEIDDVQEIINLAHEHDLDALTVRDGDWELTIVRREEVALSSLPAPLPPAQDGVLPTVTPPSPKPDAPASSGQVVKAPIIGVFYRAPSPSAPMFVRVGDRVEVGQALCILEAMKLMNEITSDYAGVVTAISVENGALVTIGQELFVISPHA